MLLKLLSIALSAAINVLFFAGEFYFGAENEKAVNSIKEINMIYFNNFFILPYLNN